MPIWYPFSSTIQPPTTAALRTSAEARHSPDGACTILMVKVNVLPLATALPVAPLAVYVPVSVPWWVPVRLSVPSASALPCSQDSILPLHRYAMATPSWMAMAMLAAPPVVYPANVAREIGATAGGVAPVDGWAVAGSAGAGMRVDGVTSPIAPAPYGLLFPPPLAASRLATTMIAASSNPAMSVTIGLFPF